MKKLFLGLSILFAVLALIGALYVLMNGGQPSPGYAVIPLVFELIFVSLYRRYE